MTELNKTIRAFLFPDINRNFLIRVILVSVVAYIVFKYIFIPFQVKGSSMVPAYTTGDINFCFTLRYMFFPIKRYDVVTVRYAGTRVMLLKRVIAQEGETMEFRNGQLYINGLKMAEPYVKGKCDWNLSPRVVSPHHVYVVGDNRGVPIETHDFGQTDVNRIIGAPLW